MARARALRRAAGAVFALALVCSATAAAQYPRDRAASTKVQEAISNHYLSMNFGQAENMLLATIKACADQCSPQTLAKAWMYVGIVRGGARGESAGAREAFETALSLDPRVKLDDGLATPDTQATFTTAKASARLNKNRKAEAAPAGSSLDTEQPGAEDAPTSGAGLSCGELPKNVQTRRPIPIACESEEAAASATLRYREFRGDDWKSLKMTRSGGGFRAQIPCDATKSAGKVSLFIVAQDAAGDPVEVLGSKGAPITIAVATRTNEPPPAFPNEPPPARCADEVICPPDFPGCKNKNEPVEVQSCESDSDCKSGECSEGACIVEKEESSSSLSASAPRNWFGLHFAADVGFIGGSDVCSTSNADFNCFSGSSNPYPGELPSGVQSPDSPGELGDPYPGTGISSGAALGTLRVLASYQRVLSERFMGELRAGFAFKGGPATRAGSAFLPVHAEARASYWLRGVAASGLRPYLHLGGGLAQVDVKVGGVSVRDCSQVANREAFFDCIEARGTYDSANDPQLPTQDLEAYRKLGQAFVTTGGGVVMALSDKTGLQFNVNAMFMLPTSGLVIEPSLGFVFGL